MDDEGVKCSSYILNFPYRHEVRVNFTINHSRLSPSFSFDGHQKTFCHVFDTKWRIRIQFLKLLPTEAISIYMSVQRTDQRGLLINANFRVEVFDTSMKHVCPPMVLPTSEMSCGQQMQKNIDEAISHKKIVHLDDKNLNVKFVLQVGSCHLLGNENDLGLNQMYTFVCLKS